MDSPATTWSSDFVTLQGGVDVAREAIHLGIDLGLRGFTLRREGDKLVVRSESGAVSLTDSEREAIGKWKTQLLVVVGFCDATSAQDTQNNLSRETAKKTTRHASK